MRYIRIVVAMFVVCSMEFAQELKCDVVVNFEKIPTATRDKLRDFEADVERYMNSTRFTDEDMLGDKIECTLSIFFNTTTDAFRYQAQVFVGSQRPVYDENTKTPKASPLLRILDDQVDFTYIPGQRMYQDDLQFDSLTDLLDYYAYMIIGFDLDSYTPSGGVRYFRKAQNICNLGQSSAYGAAWAATSSSYSRFGLADELMKGSFESFHQAFADYHFDGLDILASRKELAWRALLKSIESISKIRQRLAGSSVLIKQFFDAKYKEIAEVFSGYPDVNIYDRLSDFDSEHRSTYQEFKTRNQ